MATLAPDVTFWDAGEFITAVHVFGIPHPPGTPLYILLARTWSELLAGVPTALATNLWSAASTAAAGAVLAWLVARWLDSLAAGVAAALAAGAMSTVWLNATETEVYGSALLLVMAMLAVAHRAGRTGDARWLALLAYVIALAVPLHVSALVAAPAAIVLAAQAPDGVRWGAGALVFAVAVVTGGVGLGAAWLALAGLAMLIALAVVPRGPTTLRAPAAGAGRGGSTRGVAAMMILVTALALSAVLVLPARAIHDPWINAGNPTSLAALWETLGRRQYGAHALWPRQAPVWAQLANWFEYADWQVALGLAPAVAPSWRRTPITLLHAMLGVYGALTHRRVDRRSWRALVVLFAGASLGLVLYLNFKAGASFGWGVLPNGAPHEVRDRDYFFTLAFWTWGAWMGIGAVALGRALFDRANAKSMRSDRVASSMAAGTLRERGRLGAALGVAIAALPIALGWRAMDRGSEPVRNAASHFAIALLESAPRDAVLVVAGDNDAFTSWYQQGVRGVRRDVTVVVAPLLEAGWYRQQLARRDALLDRAVLGSTVSEATLLAHVGQGARAAHRPLSAAITLSGAERHALGGPWVERGLVFDEARVDSGSVRLASAGIVVDTVAARAFVSRFGAWLEDTSFRESIDPAPQEMLELLRCPARALAIARSGEVSGGGGESSLDSACKPR